MQVYHGTMSEYLEEVQREHVERDNERRVGNWLESADTAELIGALDHGKRNGFGWERLNGIRAELNNRSHDGDILAMPYRITDNY